MAHPNERRTELRGLFVYRRLSIDAAAKVMEISKSTAVRWKADARANGDDWDAARSANSLGDENFKQLSMQLLEDYLVQHQATMEALRADKGMEPARRAAVLASAADSFNKTMASFKRLSPEISKHAIALDTLQRFAGFTQQRYPQHVGALLEMLEPFGEELARAFA